METKLTRGGIAYDLNHSPFTIVIDYEDSKVEYRFSSQKYKDKFLNIRKEHQEKINTSLSNRFGCKVKAELIADLRLYQQIEKRGFLLFINGDKVSWLEKVQVSGNVATILND